MEKIKERDLYTNVKDWLRENHSCFKTDVDKGQEYSRIDVVGVTDVGGDLSGEVETIAVEVKQGTGQFAKASGQALGYKVYANRIYLAVDVRANKFNPDEIHIASHLGIGLIQIQNRECKEVLSSPYYKPIEKLNLLLLEKLDLGKCQLCGYFFNIRVNGQNRTSRNLKKAMSDEKGFIFWNYEVDERKRKAGIISSRRRKSNLTYERRLICPDCISSFFSKLKGG